uniref:Trypsin-18 n=2 Tax=Nilaparvata lugens TaxID=108931 RepID=A0A068F695_NILLU|nr:trypsin-18 [Nilaparvata lugens]
MESHIWRTTGKFSFATVILLLAICNSGLGFFISRPNNSSVELDAHHIQQFIVGGKKASDGEFKAQAALCKHKPDHLVLRCACTIVSVCHALTAGHCVWGFQETPEKFRILCGVTNVEEYDPNRDVFTVDKIYIHDNYENSLPPKNDIAMCRVREKFSDHSKLAPARLPTSRPRANQMGTACGWGLVSPDKKVISPDLMRVDMPVMDIYKCYGYYAPKVKVDTVGCVCGGYGQYGPSICNGDSGGPFYCNGEMIGVASWGHQKCKGYPSVFTSTYAHREFIERCMADVDDKAY